MSMHKMSQADALTSAQVEQIRRIIRDELDLQGRRSEERTDRLIQAMCRGLRRGHMVLRQPEHDNVTERDSANEASDSEKRFMPVNVVRKAADERIQRQMARHRIHDDFGAVVLDAMSELDR